MIVKNTSNKINFTLNCNGNLLFINKPIVMGILNITPDSFYEESRYTDIDFLLAKIEQMRNDGVTIIDIGAQSSRPGSYLLSWQEEWHRLEAPLSEARKAFPDLYISVDTFYSMVAKRAVILGASIINDISGGAMDEEMLTTVGGLNVPYICMHMKGTPQNMQENASYEDVVAEVMDYFIAKKFACETAGIKDIIFDPGFGFSKTITQNFTILKNLDILQKIPGNPILAGVSRKSMIYKTLGNTAAESLNGTTVLNTIALEKGAAILRVHDVKEAMQAIQLVEKLNA